MRQFWSVSAGSREVKRKTSRNRWPQRPLRLRLESMEDRTVPATVAQLGPDSLSLLTAAPNTTAQVDNGLYFLAGDGANASSLWKTDGTDAGTTPVAAPGLSGLSVYGLAGAGGTLYFTASSTGDPSNVNVYKLDSSAASGVAPVTNL